METNLDDQMIFMQYSIDKRDYEFTNMKSDKNKIDSDFTKINSDINNINTMLTQITNKKYYYLPVKMNPPKAQYHETVVLNNKKAPTLEGGNYMKIDGM